MLTLIHEIQLNKTSCNKMKGLHNQYIVKSKFLANLKSTYSSCQHFYLELIMALILKALFLSNTHLSFYCQYAKFSKLLKAKVNSLRNLWINSVVPCFVLSITLYFLTRSYVTLSCYTLLHQATRVEGKRA